MNYRKILFIILTLGFISSLVFTVEAQATSKSSSIHTEENEIVYDGSSHSEKDKDSITEEVVGEKKLLDIVSEKEERIKTYLLDIKSEENKKRLLSEISKKIQDQYMDFKDRFYSREKIFEVFMLSCINNENIYMYGGPGVGKSEISSYLSNLNDEYNFELQIVKRTTSDVILGGLSIPDISKGEYKRAISPIYDQVAIFMDELPNANADFFSDLFQVLLRGISNGKQNYKLQTRSILLAGNVPLLSMVNTVNDEVLSENGDFGRAFGDRILYAFPVKSINNKNKVKEFADKFMRIKAGDLSAAHNEDKIELPKISQEEFEVLNALISEWYEEKTVAKFYEFLTSFQTSISRDATGREGKYIDFHRIDNDRLMAKIISSVISHYALSYILDFSTYEDYLVNKEKFVKNRIWDIHKIRRAFELVLVPESICGNKKEDTVYTHFTERFKIFLSNLSKK